MAMDARELARSLLMTRFINKICRHGPERFEAYEVMRTFKRPARLIHPVVL